MSAPNVKDLATSLVATAPSPAASGTSLVVTTNQGSRFPAVPFDAIVHPADQLPTVATAERVLVTALTGDTLTIDRAEGITSAQDIEVGWRISAAIFGNHITEAYARANHTGTQAASTISDFDTEVSNNTDVAANTTARHTHANQAVLDATTASFTTADETKLDGVEALADVTDAGNVGSSIHGATGKTTPVDADTIPLIDSAASNVLKKVTWANVKATLKTYFDSLYAAVTHSHAISDVTSLQASLDAKVTGPATATDNAVARYDGTTGELVQDSSVIIADNGFVTLGASIQTPGAFIGDTFSELTPAAGITADGVLLKDGDVTVDDDAYDATSWNGNFNVPTKNAVRDKIESMGGGGGGMTSFTLSADSGSDQSITDGNTLEIAGGTGIDSVASATDTVTLNIDSTVATLTGSQTLTNKTLTSPVVNTPTGIVKGDVGLGNVDNTSDATKNAATATLTNKTLTSPVINTPTGIVKGDVGLGNVDNTSDATKNAASVTLTNKTISTSSNTITSASDTATGVVELATIAETDTGTDATRAVTPDGLSGSVYGTKPLSVYAIEAATALTTGDGKAYVRIPTALNGMNLISCSAAVITTSSSGLPTVQLARGRQSSPTTAHTFADMLSTKVTIDATEYDSKDATTAAVIDAANDDVLMGDLIRIDVDVAGTGTAGLIVTMAFRTP